MLSGHDDKEKAMWRQCKEMDRTVLVFGLICLPGAIATICNHFF